MANSEVSIANQALLLLGANQITSLDDPVTPAQVAKAFYESARDELLQDHQWNFAVRRAALVLIPDPAPPADPIPLYGFANAFQLPPGGNENEPPYCIRVIDTSADTTWPLPVFLVFGEGPWSTPARWQIEGRTLVTDAEAISIRYIGRITDPVLFPPAFDKALVYALAAKMAYPLKVDVNLTKLRIDEAQAYLKRAKALDGQEGRYPPVASRTLLDVR